MNKIKEFAFKKSPYPVILCLETFCSFDQQKKIADLLVAAFGRMLLKHGELVSEDGELPSPEQARYKVIVMGKRRGIGGSPTARSTLEDEQSEQDASPPDADDLLSPQKPSSSAVVNARTPPPPPPIRNSSVAPELSELIYFDDFAMRSTLDNPSIEYIARIMESHFDPDVNSNESVASMISWNHDCLR